jgi:hypothetical protein
MTKTASLLATTLAAFCLSVSAAQAAGIPRAWVSGNGSDAGGCGAPTAPCRSLQYVHDHIIAAGGEIDILDPAGYGAVTITKALSIVNDGVGTAGVQATSGNAITIAAAGSDVIILRGLDIEGVGTGAHGVDATSFGTLHIENCEVSNFTNVGVHVDATTAGAVYVNDTIVRNNGDAGMYFRTSSPTMYVSIDNTRAEGNAQQGFTVTNGVMATMSRTVASNNGGAGGPNGSGFFVYTDPSKNAELNCDSCVASNNVKNGFQVTSYGSGIIGVTQSTATDNVGFGFYNVNSGAFETFGTNIVRGNNGGGSQTFGTITAVSQE